MSPDEITDQSPPVEPPVLPSVAPAGRSCDSLASQRPFPTVELTDVFTAGYRYELPCGQTYLNTGVRPCVHACVDTDEHTSGSTPDYRYGAADNCQHD